MNVTIRRFLPAVIAIALLAGLPATQAIAGKGDKISAVVGGKRVKFRRGQVCDGYNQGDMTGVFSVTGGNKPHRPGQLLRGLAVGCAVDLAGGTPPLTCEIGYTQFRASANLDLHQYAGAGPDVQVTFSGYDGTHVSGTFNGTLAAADGTSGSIAVTDGKFSLVLGGDAHCTGPAEAN